jgi:uncharacterized RDD family membrane protein YckC
MFCPNCGKENLDIEISCSQCGFELGRNPALRPSVVLKFAGFWRRAIAFLLDYLIGYIVFFPLAYHLLRPPKYMDMTNVRTFYFFYLLGGWLYYSLMESSSLQGTVGKLALRIKVTDLQGHRISFGKASARFWGKLISGLILGLGFFMAGWTMKKQALHDKMAGTLVILKKSSATTD